MYSFGNWWVTRNSIYAFDPSTNTVESLQPLPDSRAYASAAIDSTGKIALFGGAQTTPMDATYSEIFVLNVKSLSVLDNLDISIQGSNIAHNRGSGLCVGMMSGVDTNIAIAGSDMGGNSDSVYLQYAYHSHLTLSMTGNDLTENSDAGVYFDYFENTDSVIDFLGNDLSDSYYGFYVNYFRNSATTTHIENNTFDWTHYAIYLEYPSYFETNPQDQRPSYFYIYNNVALNLFNGFIYYDQNYYAPIYFYIDNLVATGEPSSYWNVYFFNFEYAYNGDLHVWINNAQVSDGYYGLYYYMDDDADAYITIRDSVFTNVYYGLYLYYPAYYADLFKLEILNTEFYISEYGYGMYIYYLGDDFGCRYEMTIADSLFDDYSGDSYWYEYGIYVDEGYNGMHSWTIVDTDFANYYDYGWYLEEIQSGGKVSIWMYDGSFRGAPGQYAVSIYVYQEWYDGTWDINLVSVEGDQAYIDVTVYTGLNLDLPAPNVNVLVYDNGGGIIAGGTTDSSGVVTKLIAKQYRMSYGYFEAFTPHSVVASNGIATASAMVSLAGADKSVVLRLTGDADGDGLNDMIDPDDDNDGYPDNVDAFPNDPNEWRDTDGDGIGDNADPDDDNDGYLDTVDAFPRNPNEWSDTDNDGIGDNSDPDIDGDGYLNSNDAFPYDATEWRDTDHDGIGDNSDPDIDGDGYLNAQDAFPYDPSEWSDLDSDGVGDNKDWDIDGDGISNDQDRFPRDPNEWRDTDGDGIGDNADTDDDGDGVPDTTDVFPMNPNEWADMDGDGVLNANDAFPNDPAESRDTDHDGIGDNADTDKDGDGVLNAQDDFPLDPSEWSDMDGDGVGDNSDIDIDGDGTLNVVDEAPLDPTRSGTIFPQPPQPQQIPAPPDYTMILAVIAGLMIVLLLVTMVSMFRKGKPATEKAEEEPVETELEEKKETEKKEESEEL
jgi:hypothetical protein